MASQKYSVNQHLIETLLTWVNSGEIAIPEIQRPFVWDAAQVRDLLDSLYQGFPVGYIIVWKNPDIRLKDGSFSEGRKILIDGQQRITALTAAMLGEKVVNQEYKRTRIQIAFNPQTEEFAVFNAAIAKDKQWLPDIAPLMRRDTGLLHIIRGYRETNPDVEEDNLENVFTRLLEVSKKQIGLIELAADLDIETVTEIFIRINRKGVPLSQADFAMSKIAANENHGGPHLRKAIDYFCHLAVAPEFHRHIEENDKEFCASDYYGSMRWLRNENDDLYDPSYSDMLRVAFVSEFKRGKLADLVALLSGRNFETRHFQEEIAADSFSRLSDGVRSFINENHFKRFLMIINSAGFIDRQLVPAKLPINFAYALYLALRREGYEAAKIERLVRRWFVLSMLTARYSGPTETRFEQDIRRVSEFETYLSEVEEAELSDGFWNAGLVQDLTTSNSNHPAFRTFLAAQARDQCKGFLSHAITIRSLLEHRGDMHHIYPKNHLKKLGRTRSQYNQVANLVVTQQEINIGIGDREPSIYFGMVRDQTEASERRFGTVFGPKAVQDNFAENAVPVETLEEDFPSYDEFLNLRRRLMANRIRDFYQTL